MKRIIFITSGLLAGSAAYASESGNEWFSFGVHDAWKYNYDPTLISRRLATDLSYEDSGSDKSTTELSWSLRDATAITKNHALGYQIGFPQKWIDDDRNGDVTGIGDLDARVGLISRLSPTLRLGTGLITKFDTAADSALGDGVLQMRPVLALRWDAMEQVNLGINVEYSFTPTDQGNQDISALELKIPVAFRISHTWSAEITYKPRWNYVNDSDRHRLVLAATHNLGAEHRFAWGISGEIPLSRESFNWKIGTGINWNF